MEHLEGIDHPLILYLLNKCLFEWYVIGDWMPYSNLWRVESQWFGQSILRLFQLVQPLCEQWLEINDNDRVIIMNTMVPLFS